MPSSQCYENAAAQGTAGALAALAVGIVGVCTFNNCFLREQRARRVFPGRLVTILGGHHHGDGGSHLHGLGRGLEAAQLPPG